MTSTPLRVHPENSKYFLFRDKPLFLLTATEHYGSVLNRRFDYRRYLDDLVDKRMTMTRTFLLFRELEAATNPKSPCKPDPADYIAPWPRVGPGKALDGEPQFDLSRWNPEFFERLHDFLTLASDRGIVVELTLFSNSYHDAVWALNPLRAENNVQGVGRIEWPEYTSLKNADVLEHQKSHARKIVRETAGFDNVYYEICNEPGGGQPGHVTPAEVDAWQSEMAGVVRAEVAAVAGDPRSHLIAASEAFSYTPVFTQPLDATMARRAGTVGEWADVVNVHPLPGTVLGGRTYQLGNFMSRELKLAELRDFGRAAAQSDKPVVYDEDNAATMHRDEVGWTIHRKRAWMTLLSQAHCDFIDFSLQVGQETGTPESSRAIRTWVRHLSEFFGAFDYVHAQPAADVVGPLPHPLIGAALSSTDGRDLLVYVADAREVTDPALGGAVEGQITLPPGDYDVRFFDPVDGTLSSTRFEQRSGRPLRMPAFRHDLAVRATRHA